VSEGRVFIVDDQPAEVRRLGDLLREHGYQVQVATSGQHALAAIPEALPDLVMVDLLLPDMDGLAVCRLLREAPVTTDIPIICMSEPGSAGRRVESFEHGAVDVVEKPLEAAEVLARVKRHVTVSRVRAALQESEARFRSVTESAVDAIISADAGGVIRSWNRAAEAIFGWPAAEALGRNLELIIPERFREAHWTGLRRAAAGEPGRIIGSTVEVAALRSDGREFPVELSLAAWTLDGRRYFTGIIRDVTERKDSEAKFRSVTESAIDAIVTADQEGVIRSWNRAAQAIFGYTPEEAVGQRLELIIPERYHAPHQEGIRRVSGGGGGRVIGRTVEVAGRRKDGVELPVELSLATWTHDARRYYTGIIRDISERKAAEARLREYADELARKHEELHQQHERLRRSQEALLAFHRQNTRLFQALTGALPGSILDGKYRLDEQIGHGGFGVVFAGHQLVFDRPVAIKVFQPASTEDADEWFQRFRREGLTAVRVNHPNAVVVLDSGLAETGLPYLVMERLRGETVLTRLQRDGVFTVRRAVEVLADVADVLAAAHAGGVLHRDIKPGNVFLHHPSGLDGAPAGEVVKVLDFGIARLMDGDAAAQRITETGQFIGTPVYMAPERLLGEREDGRSDVYSAGVMLYEMVTGEAAFGGEPTPWATLWRQMRTAPVPLQRLVPGAPKALSDLALRMLHKDPGARPDAGELARSLRGILAGLAPAEDAVRD
jgi:PAS domain S-box-containing protein